MFQAISDNVALSQKIVSQVTDAIIRGDLRPGERIPTERDLAQMFGVSRTAIRDAIKILSGRGVLEVKHGVGIFVAEADKDTKLLGFAGEPLRDLFDIRYVMETQAAAWAAERANDEHIARLRQIIEEAESHSDNLDILAQKDAQFHVAIAETSQNMLLVKIMWMLLDALAESRTKALSIPNRPVASLAEHAAIVEEIAKGDASGARTRMQKHLSSVERSILHDESGRG